MDTEISFAEAMLRRGAALLEADAAAEAAQRADEAAMAGTGEPLERLARLLAHAAAAEAPLLVFSEGGSRPDLFDEAARQSAAPLTGRVGLLARARQAERAVMFEFDGTGPLTGNRIVAAILRPEERPDLLDAYIAVGRLRGTAAELTVVPAALRFDAAALARTLAMIGAAAERSVNAAGAALGHAASMVAMPGHEQGTAPAALLDLFWHGLTLSSVRARRDGLEGMPVQGSA
ncbi:hypothetical protein [Azospirillum thermophilum]|uniref:Uncharacterized protein n=1 Tax=Azospirillum thermophilum TaxID=2202148 RepID=A0A2S2CW70_9PROT|nr:hypothetical protein [Azospirillum thermophilum]AWK88716.1 hypothetical protein DEW08_21750 [Azospirillum thermophilum]